MKRSRTISLSTLKRCTHFQRKVYKEVLNIPFGEIRTYKEIAKKFDMATWQQTMNHLSYVSA